MLRKRIRNRIAAFAAPLGISAAVGVGTLLITAIPTAAPAEAQGFSIQFGSGPFYGPRPYYGPRPFYGPRPYYGHPHGYRPAYAYGPPPRCWFRPTRYWDGYGWAVGRERICR
jgi:hypothetical protein